MRTLPATLAVIAAASMALAACSDPATSSKREMSGQSSSTSKELTPFDVTTIAPVDSIAAMVPADIKERGSLRNGASTDYAPAEFLDTDGQTPIGYDVDYVKALAQVMGLKEGTTETAVFDTILPALGTKFDIGVSSFTVTAEREDAVNMVTYVEVGSAFAVVKGNPKKFDPAAPCGTTIGVQNGTYQQDYALKLSDDCVAAGKEKIKVMPLDLQSDISTKVIGGQYDATLADSTVIGYTVELSDHQLEQVGEIIESAPQAVAVAKDNAELAEAIQAATQYLMDEGYLTKILAPYGAEKAALTKAELNPAL